MSDAAPAKPEATQQVADPAPTAAEETVATESKSEEPKEEPKEELKEEPKEDDSKVQEADATADKQHQDNDRANGRSRHQKRPANSKFDASLLPETDDPTKIRAQVEFYFSDSNLPTDKFMWDQTGGSENKPVKVKKICEFRRMRRFQPYEAVVAALRDSKSLNISGPEGEEEITRKVAYEPNQHRGKADAATVYAKGFGDEEPSTQFDLEAFFTQYGSVNAVRLRRAEDKLFKGSVYVEFQDEETAKKFLELDPKPQWKGNDLKIMSKREYVDEKNTLIREGKIEPSTRPQRFFEGRESGKRGGRGRGGKNIDRDDWKSRRDHDQKNGFRRGGGRGRGRGRGGFRGDRDRNREREDRQRDDAKPTSDDKEAASDSTNKRPREEDGQTEAPPAKKVDIKEEVATEGS